MKKIAIIVALALGVTALAVSKASAENVGIEVRPMFVPYALCAASSTHPTSQHMVINGVSYRVGLSICPVVTGRSLANVELTHGLKTPQGTGTVWSLFGTPATFPQQQANGTWVIQAAKHRAFKTSVTPGGASSNMWSFPCVVNKKQLTATDGTLFTVATCRGPMMENINNKPILFGATVFTNAAVGLPNPIVASLPFH